MISTPAASACFLLLLRLTLPSLPIPLLAHLNSAKLELSPSSLTTMTPSSSCNRLPLGQAPTNIFVRVSTSNPAHLRPPSTDVRSRKATHRRDIPAHHPNRLLSRSSHPHRMSARPRRRLTDSRRVRVRLILLIVHGLAAPYLYSDERYPSVDTPNRSSQPSRLDGKSPVLRPPSTFMKVVYLPFGSREGFGTTSRSTTRTLKINSSSAEDARSSQHRESGGGSHTRRSYTMILTASERGTL